MPDREVGKKCARSKGNFDSQNRKKHRVANLDLVEHSNLLQTQSRVLNALSALSCSNVKSVTENSVIRVSPQSPAVADVTTCPTMTTPELGCVLQVKREEIR